MKKSLLIVLLSLILTTSLFGSVALADEVGATVSVANLDETNVMDDLLTGENFNVDNYNFTNIDESGTPPKLLSFVEYCFSTYSNYSELFGLYLYFYNPGGYVLSHEGHTVTLATAYKNGKPTQYESFELKLINVSNNIPDKDKVTYNMFWKFKIVDHESDYDGLTIQERVNASARQYDIAGVQLISTFDNNVASDKRVKDYKIGCSYVYTGFANGMSEVSTAPLSVSASNLDTISLEIQNTYYRSETSSKGLGYQIDVNSVYFSIPQDYLNGKVYDKLKRIKAEWYEFVTKDIVVTCNKDFYNGVTGKGSEDGHNFIGVSQDWLKDNTNLKYGVGVPYYYTKPFSSVPCYGYSWCWGREIHTSGESTFDSASIDSLMYLFLVENITSSDPDLPLNQQGGISAKQVADYVYEFPSGVANRVEIGGKQINKNLFENKIADSRLVDNAYGKVQCGFDGKSVYEFDVDAGIHDYSTWDWENSSYWANALMLQGDPWGWWKALLGNFPEKETEFENIEYFVTVLPSDFLDGAKKLGKQDFCKKYLVNSADYDNFIEYCKKEHSKGNEVLLFRFAVTDYFSEFVDTYYQYNDLQHYRYENQSYRAFGSIFLNFDIIQLTFQKGDEYVAMAVISDPINIFPSVTPPTELETPPLLNGTIVNFLQMLFSVVLVIFLVIIVVNTVKYAFKK
ncbi:MAG: hypothetical protein ACI4QL_01045 [Candidatus Fimimonas sp.]